MSDTAADLECITAALEDKYEQGRIAALGVEVVAMLLRKNLRYGSSATDPIRVFSKLDPEAGIRVRLDDKLSRIRAGAADDDEDPILDTLGYIILLLVTQRAAQ